MIKDRIINDVISREGGYVNDPADSGGETMFGITVKVARDYGYTGSMRALPKDLAFRIYDDRFWKPISGDLLEAISSKVAEEVADSAVNCSVERAAMWLQRSLNVFNSGGTLYPDLKVDGQIGPTTAAALQTYVNRREVSILIKALNSLQGAFYLELAERREKDERFVYGWFANRV